MVDKVVPFVNGQYFSFSKVFHFVMPSYPCVIAGAQSTRHAVRWTRPLIKHGPGTSLISKFYPNPSFSSDKGEKGESLMKSEKPSRPSNTINYVTTGQFQHSVSLCGNIFLVVISQFHLSLCDGDRKVCVHAVHSQLHTVFQAIK